MSELIDVSRTIVNQSNVLQELSASIKELKPELLDGLFCVSNQEAFAVAGEVRAGRLTSLNPLMVDSLSQAIKDVLRISESLEVEGLDENSLKSLDDLELPITELLDWIESYDRKASDWSYSLEDMRRPDFIGIFCMDCDAEIGGEENCPGCSNQ